MKHTESKIQQSCIKWFRLQYPKYECLLFAVPNEGKRSVANANRMKAQGMVSGVSDIIFLLPAHGFHGLCIEMKAPKMKQTDNQKKFESAVRPNYKYVVCHSLDEFMGVINEYVI